MNKHSYLITLTFICTSISTSMILPAQADGNIETPFMVKGGSDAGKIGKDSKLCSEQNICSDLNPQERSVKLKVINAGQSSLEKPKTWLVIHGWNDNTEASNNKGEARSLNQLAQSISKTHPNDRVLMLDWSEASNNNGESSLGDINRGNYYAATWIRPVAEKVIAKLKEAGIDDLDASRNLNLVGHSLGAIMSAEIGNIYKENQTGNQLIKNEDKIGVNSIVALDPASEFNATSSFLPHGDLGGYDVDGRSPAYDLVEVEVPVSTPSPDGMPIPVINPETGKILTTKEKRTVFRPKDSIQRPKYFNSSARYSRAFVGANSLAGNQELASTANESYKLNFINSFDPSRILRDKGRFTAPASEHSGVVQAFTHMVPNGLLGTGLLGINDQTNYVASKRFLENAYDGKHEGIIDVNASDKNQPYRLYFKDHNTSAEMVAGEPTILDKAGGFLNSLNPFKGQSDACSAQQFSTYFGVLMGGSNMCVVAAELENNTQLPNTDTMLSHTSAITQGNSSHIGSASYFVARTPLQDRTRESNYSGANQPSLQQSNQYTNGQIVRAPLDVSLTWNQNTKLDLDSHLVTPNSEHVYFSKRGSLNQAPNAFLYRDSIPDGGLKGAEQLRVTQFQQGEYRFYVYNYSDSVGSQAAQNAGPNGLSNSGATVKLYEGGQPLTDIPNDPNVFDLNNPNVQRVGAPYPGDSTLNIPTNQPGNTWYVFKLDTRTGILYRVNRFNTVPRSSDVPNVR